MMIEFPALQAFFMLPCPALVANSKISHACSRYSIKASFHDEVFKAHSILFSSASDEAKEKGPALM